MSLDVAIQSVAFYILSCSTCSKITHRRKAKAQAKRERAEKEALETEQPGLYRHPSPFSTNPYWTEEIMMGPALKKKGDKSASKNTSQRALNTAGQGSSYAGSTGMSTEAPSSPTAVTEGSRLSGDDWNRKRYQREDEALWGIDFQGSGQKIKEVIAKAGESAGRLIERRLSKGAQERAEESASPYYLTSRNPPVNDLHPPVVSTQPLSRDETKWMLQPPPSAKVMEGKVRVHSNRSRASSDGSTIKNSLSRQATERTLDSRLQQADISASQTELRAMRTRSSRHKSQRYQRDRSTSPDSSEESSAISYRRRKPPPLTLSEPATSPGENAVLPRFPKPTASSEMSERSSRPLLTTIVSSSNLIPQIQKSDEGRQPLRELSAQSSNSGPHSRTSSPGHNPSSTLPIKPTLQVDNITPVTAENAS